MLMWDTKHDTAVLVCPKILALQETSKTRSQHQTEFSAFSEAEHLCQ